MVRGLNKSQRTSHASQIHSLPSSKERTKLQGQNYFTKVILIPDKCMQVNVKKRSTKQNS